VSDKLKVLFYNFSVATPIFLFLKIRNTLPVYKYKTEERKINNDRRSFIPIMIFATTTKELMGKSIIRD